MLLDASEDWLGSYKISNEKVSWRKGIRMIIHLADAGAHGKLFTKYDKYPDEEEKLVKELIKCAEKNIEIIGYVIAEESRNTFNECCKIYRNKGGIYEICDFIQEINHSDLVIEDKKDYRRRMREESSFSQKEVNRNFRMNAVRNVGERMKRRFKDD